MSPSDAQPVANPEQAPLSERTGVTVLEQALWRDLQQAGEEATFNAAWLGLTCRTIKAAIAGALLLRSQNGSLRLAASWPDGTGLAPSMAVAVQAAVEAGRGMVQPAASGTTNCFALPIQLNGAVIGAVGVDVGVAAGHDPRSTMRQLQWAAAWVRERRLVTAARDAGDHAGRVAAVLELMAATVEQTSASAALHAAASGLASKLECERVSLGFLRGGRARVTCISHSAAFGERMALTRAIEAAMDEAIDQFALVLAPAPDGAVLVTEAAAQLARMHNPATVLTVPLLTGETPVGAITFERPADRPFSQGDVALIEAVAGILGPALSDKRQADRWLLLRAADALGDGFVGLVGEGHLGAKLLVLVAVALGLAANFVHIDYTVHAHARIAGSVQRAVAAPFDGFVREAPVRAGAEVAAGDLLVALDDRDLVLERLRWATERAVHSAEYDQALSTGKRADAVRMQSQIAQADAQIRLADEQLARTRLTAPFAGLVVSGDLSQSIGAPVRRGDVLFEVAPLNDYRVELQVPEGQVADVALGAKGDLVVAALPDEKLALTIALVTPVADAKDGQVTFRADATLNTHSARLRPGMEGIAKIDAGRARAVWVWTRGLRNWLRLTLWSWWP
jgi:multidrug efflux pump subunit AcrA (membrane-fusion protein)